MRISDTATLLNDMCLFAPATLIDKRIRWELVNDNTVKAVFTTDYCMISVLLFFNDQGELVNFTTNDRYDVNGKGPARKYKWSTPIKGYKEIDGLKLVSDVEVIWDYPEGPYCYLEVTNIRSIKYNCSKPH